MNDLTLKKEEMDSLMVMANEAFNSKYFEKIGGKSAIFIIMARAKEIGMPVLEAIMGGMNIIQGRVTISPFGMNSMIRRAGHKVEILECTNMNCKLKGTRKDTGETLVVNYHIQDARTANIYKGAWLTYPDDMCFKSALSKLARRLFPDVISTSYVEGEISDSNKEDNHAKPPQATEIIQGTVEIIQAEQKVEESKSEELIDPNQELHLMDLTGGDEELLKTILSAFEIDNLSKIKARLFDATCRRIIALKQEMVAK